MLGFNGRCRLGTRRAVAAMVIGVIALAAPAMAQPGQGGGGFGRGGGFGGFGGDALAPSIDSRELDRMRQTLSMTPEQVSVVKLLFEGYQEQFRARSQDIRDQMDAARNQAQNQEQSGRAAFTAIAASMNSFREERNKMEETFFADVQAVLTPEQIELWPKVERTRRRERTVGRGMMSGERLDVIKLVEGIEVTPQIKAEIAPILERYEIDLDRELINRNKIYDEGFGQMTRMGGGDREQMETQMQQMMTRAREASVRVRDINRKYARQISALLPDTVRASFDRKVQETSFPNVYRPSGAARQITAAAGFGDLDADQKAAIAALRESFDRKLEAVNTRLAAATEEAEMSVTVGQIMRMRGGDDQGPVGELRSERRALEQATAESLKKILSPTQIERLPQAEDRNEQRQRGRGGEDRPRQRQEGDQPRRDGGRG